MRNCCRKCAGMTGLSFKTPNMNKCWNEKCDCHLESIGEKMWISGNFTLYKTDNILQYADQDLKKVELGKQEVTIIDTNKFMLTNGDIFLI